MEKLSQQKKHRNVCQITRDTENRTNHIKEVHHHELSSVPLAFSNPDTASNLCNTAKNELFKFLKISLGTKSVVPVNRPKIYDGVVLFQNLPATLSMLGNIPYFQLNKTVKDSYRV